MKSNIVVEHEFFLTYKLVGYLTGVLKWVAVGFVSRQTWWRDWRVVEMRTSGPGVTVSQGTEKEACNIRAKWGQTKCQTAEQAVQWIGSDAKWRIPPIEWSTQAAPSQVIWPPASFYPLTCARCQHQTNAHRSALGGGVTEGHTACCSHLMRR